MEQTQDATVVSSTTQEDVQPVESSPQQDEKVPFHQHPRFKELIEEKNSLKEELNMLKSLIEKDKPVQEETIQPVQDEVPDVLDNPKEFAKYIKEQAKKEIYAENEQKLQKENAAKKFYEDQYSKLTIEFGKDKVNEDVIGQFAIDHNIRHKDGGYDLINAFKLMQQIEKVKVEAKSETMDSLKRAKSAPVSGGGSSTKDIPLPKVSQSDLKKIPMSKLIGMLSRE